MSFHRLFRAEVMSPAGRIHRTSIAGLRLCASLAVTMLAGVASAQGIGFTLDFENGDLHGWRASGDAFRFQPTLGDNPTARGRGMPSNHQDRYWIGTYEMYQGRPGQRPGQVQGDEPQGELRSASFVSPGGTLSFLIGGGKQFETRVELRLEDQIEGAIRLYYATGSDNETMRRETWDLNEYVGRAMHIRIIDNSSSGWGHINVDDFRFSALVKVPALRDRVLSDAHRVIEQAGLAIGETNYMGVGDRPDLVIRQSPPAGQLVARGTAIALYVSMRPPTPPSPVVVPDVIGDDVRLAERKIAAARLSLRSVTREDSEQAARIIIDQDPPAGTEVPVDSPVELTVSTGVPQAVEVPDVTGMKLRNGARTLIASGLRTGQITEQEDPATAGTIFRQDPEGGRQAARGSAVVLWVAKPPEPVIVPDLVGRSLTNAQAALHDAQLQLGRTSRELSASRPNSVISQQPPAGTRVPPDTAVSLVVAGWAVWLVAGLGGALAAAMAGYLLKPQGPKALPGVTTEVHVDPGRIDSTAFEGDAIESELRVKLIADAGQQWVDVKTNAIKSEQIIDEDD